MIHYKSPFPPVLLPSECLDLKAATQEHEWSPLHLAVFKGNRAAVVAGIQNHLHLDTYDAHGFLPVHLAAISREEIYLLFNQPEAKTWGGFTAEEIRKFILEAESPRMVWLSSSPISFYYFKWLAKALNPLDHWKQDIENDPDFQPSFHQIPCRRYTQFDADADAVKITEREYTYMRLMLARRSSPEHLQYTLTSTDTRSVEGNQLLKQYEEFLASLCREMGNAEEYEHTARSIEYDQASQRCREEFRTLQKAQFDQGSSLERFYRSIQLTPLSFQPYIPILIRPPLDVKINKVAKVYHHAFDHFPIATYQLIVSSSRMAISSRLYDLGYGYLRVALQLYPNDWVLQLFYSQYTGHPSNHKQLKNRYKSLMREGIQDLMQGKLTAAKKKFC